MPAYKQPADIKVGVIGYGGAFNMGKAHLTEMQKAGMTPTAVSEIDPTRLAVAKSDFPNIQTYGDVGEMLKKSDVQLLALITPHNTHAALALQCLKAGRHVVSEKPLAITTAECDGMIKEAQKRKVVLSTYHNRHWDGCVLNALKQIRSGAIGEAFRVECTMGGYSKPQDWWRSSKTISGGVLFDWGVHLLEYSLQILEGSKLSEVSGFKHSGYWGPQIKWKEDANEDEGFATVRFHDGKWITLRITSLDSRPKDKMWVQVTGTKGSLAFSGPEYELVQVRDGVTHVQRGANPASEGHKLYQNIADHLTKGEELIITGAWARRPIHILDLACQSAEKNKTLPAKYE